ncbi:eat-18 [Bugula neritina]|uniref:Eat-18 n=1 Tax=Bugula neritina TaxID=10212 RepID=A0A7J7IT33_BUGNE|nr:eat-18 [Bugula neritina]
MKVVEIGLVLLYTSFQISAVYQDCPDVIITSEYNKTGNFSSPSIHGIYDQWDSIWDLFLSNYPGNLKCLIKFVGGPNERVQINFTDFRLDGFPNELIGVSTGCTNDYIDIYTEIEHPITISWSCPSREVLWE